MPCAVHVLALEAPCEVDPLTCPGCGGTMKVISFITEEDPVYKILNHLHLIEPEPPPRPPPERDLCAAAIGDLPDEGPFDPLAFAESWD